MKKWRIKTISILLVAIMIATMPVEGSFSFAVEEENTDENIDNVSVSDNSDGVENGDNLVQDENTVSDNCIEEDINTFSDNELNNSNDIASGSYKNVTWRIDSSGKLWVNGEGEFSEIDESSFSRAPWYEFSDKILSAKIELSNVKNLSGMFYNCRNLTDVDLSKLDTSKSENMSYMFSECSKLNSLDLSSFETSNVTDMSYMFCNMRAHVELNVSSFDTHNVLNMSCMFAHARCTELNVKGFDTSKVTDMSGMFEDVSEIDELDLSNFNTANVENMSWMFSNIFMDRLDVSSFDTKKVRDYSSMFRGSQYLVELDLSSFDFCNAQYVDEMLYGCVISSLKTPKNVNIELPLYGKFCEKGKNIVLDAVAINTKNSLDLYRLNSDSEGGYTWSIDSEGKLIVNGTGEIPETQYRGESIKSKSPWFGYRKQITSAEMHIKNATNLEDLFYGHTNLSYANLNDIDSSTTTNMDLMFLNCANLKKIDLDKLDTHNVTNMRSMFSGCSSLTDLNLSGFNTAKVPNMSYLFYECSSLEELDLSGFDTRNVTNMSSMFYNCSSLPKLDLTKFDSSNVTNMYSMFRGCSSLKKLNLSNFDTTNVTNMYGMFMGCSELNNLNLSSFNTEKVTDMPVMFYNCSSLSSIDLSNFDMNNVKSAYSMFYGCNSLKQINAPINVNVDIALPGEGWYREDTGKAITAIPKGLSKSVVLKKGSANKPAITKIKLEAERTNLIIDEKIIINAIITPNDGDASKITWTTSNNNVATVAGIGATATVTAVGEGTATITATAGKVTATATVTVSQPVRFDKHEISLVAKPGSQATITATVTGKGYTTADLEWSSTDTGVATVDRGVVTANADLAETKTATIKAIIKGTEYSDSCLVTVNVAGAAMAPTATPVGEVDKNTRVILTSETVGADIYYTTDGSVPSVDATGKPQGSTKLYTDAIIIDKAITVKAFASCEGYKDSQVVSFVYTIKQEWGDVANYASVMQLFADSSYIPEGIWYVLGDKVYTESDASDVVKNYTGAKITFNDEIQVFHETRKLWENRDYTISYKNNQNVAGVNDGNKAPAVSIKGKGSYTKTSELKFTIAATDINEAELTSEKTLCVNAGTKLNSIKPVLMFEGKKLGANKDYSLAYTCGGNAVSADTKTEAGKTYEISISGKARFKNAHNKKIVVKVIDTKNKDVISMSKVKVTIPKQEWKKGQPVDVEKLFKDGVATVNNGKDRLEYGADRDFTVDAASYDGAGKYNIAIHGTGRTGEGVKSYVGDKNAVLEITGIPAGKIKVSGLASNIEYTGKAYTLPAGVKLSSTAGDLKEGTDYTVEIHDSGAVGKVNIVFALKGQYTGIIKKTVNVKAKSIAGAVVTATAADYSKAGAIPATVTVKLGDQVLREGIDYTLSYSNNAKAGVTATVTAKGIGNYTGMATAGFRVNKSEITDSVTLVAADKVYNAKAKAGYFKSAPKLMDGGKAISVGKDIDKINTKTAFRYYYANTGEEIPNNAVVAAGTTIEVRVIVNCGANSPYKAGQYELKGYYKILDAGKDIKSAKVVMKNKNIQFNNGKAIIPLKESDLVVTVGKTILKSTDYEIVSIRNNRFLGTATVEIRGKGQYGGSKTFTFKINAKALK